MPQTSPTTALLCIWHDVEADYDQEYLRWHSFEHLPERLALPGFVSAQRYELIDGPGQQFCCFLDVESLAAFHSAAYQARLDDPTEWTRRLMPRYTRVQRALCEKRWEIGCGSSGTIACVRVAGSGDASSCADLEAACIDLYVNQHILRARLGELDQAVTGLDSEEKRLRRTEDSGGYGLTLLVDALSAKSLHAAMASFAALLTGRGLRFEISSYRLSCSLWSQD
jgi:hypothetical protein